MLSKLKPVTLSLAVISALTTTATMANDINYDDLLKRIEVPKGFSVSYFAKDVENARDLAISKNGIVFAGSRRAGKVHALVDADSNGAAEKMQVVAEGLNMPSGIAYHQGDLFVAEIHQVLRFKDIEKQVASGTFKSEVVIEGLPTDRHHGWKFIRFDEQGRLYVPVGVPCNVCAEDDKYGVIYRYDLKTKKRDVIAKGVRNSVGFDFHPSTKELWFSDNGRDMMGDDIPPCEINRVAKEGSHFGFPYFHGGTIADPEFGQGKQASDYVMPALNLGAHVAPLGIEFYTSQQFPAKYQSQLFVAEHGSWNRTKKAGYRVMVANVENDKVTSYEPFMTGFMANETTYGRPVAFAQMADGSLLVSDDYANAVYRVTYNNN